MQEERDNALNICVQSDPILYSIIYIVWRWTFKTMLIRAYSKSKLHTNTTNRSTFEYVLIIMIAKVHLHSTLYVHSQKQNHLYGLMCFEFQVLLRYTLAAILCDTWRFHITINLWLLICTKSIVPLQLSCRPETST